MRKGKNILIVISLIFIVAGLIVAWYLRFKAEKTDLSDFILKALPLLTTGAIGLVLQMFIKPSGEKANTVNVNTCDSNKGIVIAQGNAEIKEIKQENAEVIIKDSLVNIIPPSQDPQAEKKNLPNLKQFTAPTPHFTGRKELLEKIRQTFENNEETINLTQAIVGLGGIGKTQIARKYASNYRNEYEYIWSVNAETNSGMDSSFQDFAQEAGIINDAKDTNAIKKEVLKWMYNNDNWLFIYDNAENVETLQPYLPENRTGRRHVLITSRYKYWKSIAKEISLELFSPDEAAEFLTHRTDLPTDEHQKALAERLGYLSLALEQAGAFISQKDDYSYEKYLMRLKKYHLEMFKNNPDIYSKKSVDATWNISFQSIENESSKQLLHLFAFLAPVNIGRYWFIQAKDVLPQPLKETVADEHEFEDAIEELTKYSLVTLKDDAFSIHRLVQEVIRDSLKPNEAQWQNYCINHNCPNF